MSELKWRVERVGSASSGYGPGWIAMDGPAVRGAVFETHHDAVTFADRQARSEFERDSKRALIKLGSRGVPAAGIPPVVAPVPALTTYHPTPVKRGYQRVTHMQVRLAAAMRENGRSWREIAEALGVKHSTIRLAVIRDLGRTT